MRVRRQVRNVEQPGRCSFVLLTRITGHGYAVRIISLNSLDTLRDRLISSPIRRTSQGLMHLVELSASFKS